MTGGRIGVDHLAIIAMLEAAMVLSVDCPVLNTGIGGSAHMEDLSLITADGAEPIHTITDPVVIV